MDINLGVLAVALNELPLSGVKQYTYTITTHTDSHKIHNKVCITCKLSRFQNNQQDSEEIVLSITKTFPKDELKSGKNIVKMELIKSIFQYVSTNRYDFFMARY